MENSLFIQFALRCFADLKMQWLKSVFLLLTMSTFTGECRECIDKLHETDANLTSVVECLAKSGNQTAYFEHTLWKVDLLQRRIEGLAKIISQTRYRFVPSPYQDIDDVLRIEGSVAGYSCQQKVFVVQAIRRKLEQVYTMNGIESTLFRWPFKRKRSVITTVKPLQKANDYIEPRTRADDYTELTCLILLAIGNNSGSTP